MDEVLLWLEGLYYWLVDLVFYAAHIVGQIWRIFPFWLQVLVGVSALCLVLLLGGIYMRLAAMRREKRRKAQRGQKR